MNDCIKLLNTEMMETKNEHTGALIEQNGLLFHMVTYSSYTTPLFLIYTTFNILFTYRNF
jgi:hypothetical protein